MDIQLKKGVLEICILSAMLEQETYGYELIKTVSSVIEISVSTLYPIMRRLEGAGCVSSRTAEHNGRLRRYYAITQAGRQKIGEFLNEWASILKICDFITEKYNNDKK